MRLSAPTKNVFYISVVLAIVAVVSSFAEIQYLSSNAFWILLAGYLLLAAGNYLKGF